MADDTTSASGKPVAPPNENLQQVVQNGEKPASHSGKPIAQPKSNLNQSVIRAPKTPPKQK